MVSCIVGLQTAESVADNGVGNLKEDSVAGSATAQSSPEQEPATGQGLRRKSVSFADEPVLAAPLPEAQLPQQRGMKKGFLDRPKPALKKSSMPARALRDATGSLDQVGRSDAASQRHADEGRDAAFSGKVVERAPEAVQQGFGVGPGNTASPAGAATEQVVHQGAAQTPVKKLSRFKQQRAGS